MQDEVNYQVMGFLYRGARFGMTELVKVLSASRGMVINNVKSNKAYYGENKTGKMTLKQLKDSKEILSTVDISKENIKEFEKIARKYNIDFALNKGKDEAGDFFIIFFKVKDMKAIDRALDELIQNNLNKNKEKEINKKQEVDKAIKKGKEKSKDINRVLEKVKVRSKDRSL